MPSRHAVKQRKIGRTAAFCFSTIGLMIGDVWLDSRFRATSFFKLGEEECPVQSVMSVMQYAAEVAFQIQLHLNVELLLSLSSQQF
jgi:hypothetical protein